MRRVVTGEQVAQIYNPDPFARPVLRAPVYQTPVGLILIAWLIRGLARLVRLIIRHPGRRHGARAAGVHVGQHRLDRPGRHGGLGRAGPGDLAALLAGFVHPVGGDARTGQVAGLGLPAPLGRGDDHRRPGPLVSGPDHLARPRQGHLHPVRRPGTRPAGVRPVAPPTSPTGPTTWPTGSAPCYAGSAPPGPGRWCWSSSAVTPWPPSSPPCPSPTSPTCGRCRSAAGRTACRGWSGCTAPTSCSRVPPERARRPCCGGWSGPCCR